MVYTPGVAEVCREIAKDVSKVYDYTFKSNSVVVVTDGSAVLGLGNPYGRSQVGRLDEHRKRQPPFWYPRPLRQTRVNAIPELMSDDKDK